MPDGPAPEAVRAEAGRQRDVELPQCHLALAHGREVVAVDHRILRRLAHRLARNGDHLVERGETRFHTSRDRSPARRQSRARRRRPPPADTSTSNAAQRAPPPRRRTSPASARHRSPPMSLDSPSTLDSPRTGAPTGRRFDHRRVARDAPPAAGTPPRREPAAHEHRAARRCAHAWSCAIRVSTGLDYSVAIAPAIASQRVSGISRSPSRSVRAIATSVR